MSLHYSVWKDIPSDSLHVIAECQALLEYIYLLAAHCSHPHSRWGLLNSLNTCFNNVICTNKRFHLSSLLINTTFFPIQWVLKLHQTNKVKQTSISPPYISLWTLQTTWIKLIVAENTNLQAICIERNEFTAGLGLIQFCTKYSSLLMLPCCCKHSVFYQNCGLFAPLLKERITSKSHSCPLTLLLWGRETLEALN